MITETKAIKLLPLAEEYELPYLKKACHRTLLKYKTPRLEFVTLAQKYDLSELLDKGIKDCAAKNCTEGAYYSNSIEAQLKKPENQEISLENLCKIYKYVSYGIVLNVKYCCSPYCTTFYFS